MWLGPEFATAASPVAQLLFAGSWINGMALMPGALLYGNGCTDIVAKFHALELAPFLGILWFLVHAFGLPGAAFAWCLRVAVGCEKVILGVGRRLSALESVCYRPAVALLRRGLLLRCCGPARSLRSQWRSWRWVELRPGL